MRRREFTTLLGGAAATWPLAAYAQQRKLRVGVLLVGAGAPPRDLELARQLAQIDYIEGRNITYEIRGADGDIDRLPQLARELTAKNPDVIVGVYVPSRGRFGGRNTEHTDRDDDSRGSDRAGADQQHLALQPQHNRLHQFQRFASGEKA
jgi:hypothetical protein